MSNDLEINGVQYNGVNTVSITGSEGEKVLFYPDAVRYNEQTLTDDQKTQARENIDAASAGELKNLSEEIVDLLPKNQGSVNVGKILVVGADGNITLTDMPSGGSDDAIGYVDENNNIILSGLPDGTYVLKYENTNGTYADICTYVVGGVVQYAIVTTLTECTPVSGNASVINEGGTVTLKYVSKDGFALPSTVTVSGASYTWDSVTGTLVLSNPTTDVTIAITATKSGYDNLYDTTASGFVNNSRIGSDGTPKAEGACNGAVVTNFILISDKNKPIYIKGLDIINKLPDGNVTVHSRYSSADASTFIGKFYGSNLSGLTRNGDITSGTFGQQVLSGEYLRLTGTLLDGYSAEDVVITLGEEITD